MPTLTKKVVLLGATAVGKTSIFNRIQQNEYIEENVTTMAAYFRPKTIEFPEFNCKVKINLWDTAGQERFASLTRQYVQAADGVMLVYDITDSQSLEEAHEWYNRMQQQIDPKGIVIALVGNKSDDIERQEVSKADMAANAARLGSHVTMQVSAKTGDKIEKLFHDIGTQLIKRDGSINLRTSSVILADNKNKKEKKGCCGGGSKKAAKK